MDGGSRVQGNQKTWERGRSVGGVEAHATVVNVGGLPSA